VSNTSALTWEEALADCDARLDAAEAGIGTGSNPAVAPFSVPELAGPCPDPLLGHVRSLIERGTALEERLTTERERIRLELRRLPRLPRAQGESHFDTRA